MPPQVALLLCSAFVFLLLRYDHKQSKGMSFALWIPTIWMVSVASKPLGVWFESSGGDEMSGSLYDQLLLVVLLALGAIVLFRRKFDIGRGIRENIWLVILLGFMFVSVFWSEIPLQSFKRWVREFEALIMAFVILSEPDSRQAMLSSLRRTVYILTPFSLLLIKYFHELGVVYGRWNGEIMWVGVTLQKNGLGRLALISVFFQIWTFCRRREGHDKPAGRYQNLADALVLLISLILLNGPPGTYSATALASFAAGIFLFVCLIWFRKQHVAIGQLPTILVGFVICLGIITPWVGGSSVASFSSVLGRDSTLTGRTEIWELLRPFALDQPFLGYGFGGFWTPAHRDAIEVGEAHNGYLDVTMGLGAVGLAITSIYLISGCRKAVATMREDFFWGNLLICCLLMTVVHNISESSIDSFNRQLMATIAFLLVTVPLHGRPLQVADRRPR